MTGKAKELIERLVKLRSRGHSGTEHFVRAHLVLIGINPDEYTESTDDDPETVRRLQEMIQQFKESV